MNESHKTRIKINRLSRCKRRLSDKDLPNEQRNQLAQRISELQKELK